MYFSVSPQKLKPKQMKVKCNICIEAKPQNLPNIKEVNDEAEIFCNSCGKFLAVAEKYMYPHKWAIDKKYTSFLKSYCNR